MVGWREAFQHFVGDAIGAGCAFASDVTDDVSDLVRVGGKGIELGLV